MFYHCNKIQGTTNFRDEVKILRILQDQSTDMSAKNQHLLLINIQALSALCKSEPIILRRNKAKNWLVERHERVFYPLLPLASDTCECQQFGGSP